VLNAKADRLGSSPPLPSMPFACASFTHARLADLRTVPVKKKYGQPLLPDETVLLILMTVRESLALTMEL
jgi:hypothetical protein